MSGESPIANLLGSLPAATGEEIFETIVETPGLRLERIVSSGQGTPPGQWYDQERDEWVLLLGGGAACLILRGRAGLMATSW